ncbi:hypothetical protein [Nocardia bovistercoris]|uniref:DUF8020 domain-containing protein n=1 Tax=Nocardia bovistercoris TaxID=2785916 RepID=A0A931IFB2_9NOCA|nr:hypothetical protein [Nocardia bovistercoris]MBH0779027.1 hypothetical protein [Nocardia bovistercoris]
MLMRKFAATSALLIAALGVTAGTVNAAPAEPAAAQPVGVNAHSTDTQSIFTIDSGSIVVENDTLKVKDNNGTVVAGTELKFRLEDYELPIAAEISGRTATLTPQLDVDKAVYKPVALPYENQAPWKNEYDRELAAFNRLKDTISVGATIGTLVGGISGAAIGCVLGGIVGATVASATLVGLFGPFIPAAALGCVGGMAAIGFLGTLIGQILITAPVAIAAAIQYIATTTAPPPAPAK